MSLKSHEIVMKLLYLSYEQMFIVFFEGCLKKSGLGKTAAKATTESSPG